jgi:hypothetical protein
MKAIVSLAALKAANICASTEAARYYICGVLLTVEPRYSLYVATDGHVMFVHRFDLAEEAEDNTLTGSWLVPSDAIKGLKTAKSRFVAADCPATLTIDAEGRVVFEAEAGAVTVTKPVDGTFPQWRRVLPAAIDRKAPVERVHFNPELLARVAKAAGVLGIPAIQAICHTGAPDCPFAVTFGAERQTFGVVMPALAGEKLGTWAGLPVWAGGTPPAPKVELAPEAIAAE